MLKMVVRKTFQLLTSEEHKSSGGGCKVANDWRGGCHKEHLDYDTIAKSASIMTVEVANNLEDILIQIVKDKAWDES